MSNEPSLPAIIANGIVGVSTSLAAAGISMANIQTFIGWISTFLGIVVGIVTLVNGIQQWRKGKSK